MKRSLQALFITVLVVRFSSVAFAQDESTPQGVVIERAALTLRSPENYKVPLQLEPVRTLPVVAPMDGVVQSVFVKAGASVNKQMELLRLDSQELSLQLKEAQARYELAKLESELAATEAKKVAELKLEVAKKGLDLAQFRVDQTIIRSALDGQVIEMNVTPGQFVRAGDLLARVIDPTELFAMIPVDRQQIDPAKPFPLTVEDQTIDAKVDAVLPPLEKFAPLRDLFVSVATARVLVPAAGGNLTSGQNVYSNMVPKFPVAEIQAIAVKTDTLNADSERMVQVIREGFVRNIPVQTLGQVGQTHVFVSGRFVPGDELVVSASQDLPDGSWVRPMLKDDPVSQKSQQVRPNGAPVIQYNRNSD